jgi:hypothetical protein
MKEFIAYETWHGVAWLGGEDQGKNWLDGQVASVKGKSEAKRWTAWWGAEAKDLAPMYQCNGEEQVKSTSMNQHVAWWYEVDHIICDGVDGY